MEIKYIIILLIFNVLALLEVGTSETNVLERGYCNKYYPPPTHRCHMRYYKGFICKFCNESWYQLKCYTKSDSTVTVSKILQGLYINDTFSLEISVNNLWDGHLPFYVAPIKLTAISRLKNLKRFMLQQKYFSYSQPFSLVFDNTTFLGLDQLEELSIRIPLQDRCLRDMIKPLVSLNYLDLSFTRGLTVSNIKSTLNGLNKDKIKYLCLRTFQLIGGDGYSPVLNISEIIQAVGGPLRNLTEIDFSDNSLARITPGISVLAPKLNRFDISGNALLDSHNVPIIVESILHPQIMEFNVGYQGYIGGGIPKPSHHKKQRYSETELDDDEYSYNSLNKHSKDSLLSGINPFIVHCININSDRNISNIMHSRDILCQILQCFAPIQFGGIPCNVFPKFANIFDLGCSLYIRIPVSSNLKNLLFTHIHWEEATTTGIRFQGIICVGNNSLNSVIFSSNANWAKAGKVESTLNHITGIKGLENLITLTMDRNNLTSNISSITTEANLGSLKHLDLSHNFFHLNEDLQLCKTMQSLKEVNLEYNNLTSLPVNMVTNCSDLERLYLRGNNLSDEALVNLDFNGTTNLKFIDISQNSVKTLNPIIREKLKILSNYSEKPIELDISENPMSCKCDIMTIDFIKWVQTTKDVYLRKNNTYYCSGRDGFKFIHAINIQRLQNECFPSNLIVIVISVSTTVGSMLFIASCAGIYNFRWRLKYKLYILGQSIKRCCGCSDRTKKKWKYDAFVSYSADDRFWVHDVLMKTLENTYGFKLCIHYRDFPVGGCIFETVSQSMENSRHIILVLSDISISSNMCQFEIEEAQKQAVQRQMPLLFIKLGYLTKPITNARIAYLLDRHTYLEWADDYKTHKLFWAKLVGHLYDDVQGPCCGCCCNYGTKAIGYREIIDPQRRLSVNN